MLTKLKDWKKYAINNILLFIVYCVETYKRYIYSMKGSSRG